MHSWWDDGDKSLTGKSQSEEGDRIQSTLEMFYYKEQSNGGTDGVGYKDQEAL